MNLEYCTILLFDRRATNGLVGLSQETQKDGCRTRSKNYSVKIQRNTYKEGWEMLPREKIDSV